MLIFMFLEDSITFLIIFPFNVYNIFVATSDGGIKSVGSRVETDRRIASSILIINGGDFVFERSIGATRWEN